MGRSTSRCDKNSELKRGPWTQEEDKKLMDYINKNGHGNWRTLPKNAGLQRCGKSCRLRWTNYLRPDIKRGRFSFEEEEIIISLHSVLGNKWAAMVSHLPGRTDNGIKNYWNTHIRKRMLRMGIDPVTHKPTVDFLGRLSSQLPLLPANCNPTTTTQGEVDVARLMEGINDQILMIVNNLISSSTISPQYDNIIGTYPQPQYQMVDVPQQQIHLLPLPNMHEVQVQQPFQYSSVPCTDIWGESLLINTGNGMVDYNSCFTTPQNLNNFVSTNLNPTSTYINSGITTEEDMDSFTIS